MPTYHPSLLWLLYAYGFHPSTSGLLFANLRVDVNFYPRVIRETSKGGAVCDPASLLQKTEKGRSTRSRGYAKPEWKVSPWHPFPSSGIPYQHHNAKGKVLLYTIRINSLSVDILIHIYIYTYVKKI